jgi:hypothetical protein
MLNKDHVSAARTALASIAALAFLAGAEYDPENKGATCDPSDRTALYKRAAKLVQRAALDEYRPKVEAIIASKVKAHPAYLTSAMLQNPECPASMRDTLDAMLAMQLADEEKRTIAVSDFVSVFGEGTTIDTAAERLGGLGFEVVGKQSAKRIKLPATAYKAPAPSVENKGRKVA